MDVKLDSLIEKIKKEGIEKAQQSSDELLEKAKQEAAKIIDKANKDAAKIIEEGNGKVDQHKNAAEADLKQAARNAELLLKDKINGLFDNVFKKQVAATLTPDFLKELILSLVNNWAKNAHTEIVLNKDEKEKLEAVLFSGLKTELKDTITIKTSSDIAKGFRIGLKDDQVHYDFTDEAIAEVIKSLINPTLKQILDK